MRQQPPESVALGRGVEKRPMSSGVAGAAGAPEPYPDGLPSVNELHAAALEDARLAALLLAAARAERRGLIEADAGFRRRGLARLFALRAEEALLGGGDAGGEGGDERRAEELAELAAAVASMLPGDASGKARRTEALAYWLQGKALLAGGQQRLAEEAFCRICAVVPDRRPSPELALACYGLGQLEADRDRVDAATGLLLRAAHLWCRLGAAGPAAACQAQLGLVLHETGDLENATIALRGALALLGGEDAAAPALAARMWLTLAEIDAILDRAPRAWEDWQAARRLYGMAGVPAEEIARQWLEARAAIAAERPADAERLLDGVRRALLAGGSAVEGARATWDQVLLRMEFPQLGGVEELTAALAGESREWGESIAALARLRAERPETFYGASIEFRRWLRLDPPAGTGWPDLLTPPRRLADRLLRGRGEDVAGERGAVGEDGERRT